MKRIFLFVLSLVCFATLSFAQGKTSISVKNPTHNFGIIKEEDGDVEHTFIIENTGKIPLVIDRVTTSCGCALPEWEKEPIAPGKTTEVKIWYDPYGRPGAFNKKISVYSNAEPRRFAMSINGEVIRKSDIPELEYDFSAGDLKLFSKAVSFNTIAQTETLGEKIPVKNGGEKTLTVRMNRLPSFITAEAKPVVLGPNETGEIVFLFNGGGMGSKGRYHSLLPLTVTDENGRIATEQINFGANVIDNFENQPASFKENPPVAQVSSTLVDFGQNKALKANKAKATETIEITNSGKHPLHVYSISSDDGSVLIKGGKKIIKPNGTASFKLTIHPKTIKSTLESTVTVVCNDPNGPVRLVKIIAEK